MVEGFEQSTDRAFANFLTHSKGSVAEALKRLKQAYFQRYITADELNPLVDAGEELAKMLGGFIKYLRRTDWKNRGSHRAQETPARQQGNACDPPKSEHRGNTRGTRG